MKITSVNNETIKSLLKLSKKKYRDANGKLLVEGEHLLQEVKASGLNHTTYGIGSEFDVEITDAIAHKLSTTQSGSTLFTVVDKPQHGWPQNGKRFILCDGVQDPGNLGTIIRTAHSFGFDAVIVSNDSVDEFNDKVVRSTQGSIFHMPVIRMSLEDAIARLKGESVSVYATYLGDNTVPLSAVTDNPIAFVVGSEGQGVSDAVLEKCDGTTKIETGNFESLNVAIATAIICYTFRQ